MDRRLVLGALACCATGLALAQEAGQQLPQVKISAGELYQSLSARFPLRMDLGLMNLRISAPQLLLLPARNKLGAALVARAAGPALRSAQSGEVDVVFALRYEASDRSIRAWQPDVLAVRLPGLAPDAMQALRAMLPALTQNAVGEVILHRFTPGELALPDTMGFAPDRLTVQDDGLLVQFAPKPMH
jgi:hypothetical protein